MKRVARFGRVSLKQFTEGWLDAFPGSGPKEAESVYENIRLPRRATAGSAGYDFSVRCLFVLKPGRPSEFPQEFTLRWKTVGAETLPEKRAGFQVPSAAE